MVKIISSFNSSIPSVRKVKNWLQTDHITFGMVEIGWLYSSSWLAMKLPLHSFR